MGVSIRILALTSRRVMFGSNSLIRSFKVGGSSSVGLVVEQEALLGADCMFSARKVDFILW